jgi:hypothetical protein
MAKLKNEFVSSQGGMNALEAKAKEAGIALDAMFRAKSAAQLQAAIAGIKSQLDLWEEGQDAINEAMDKYGITVAEMGPKFAQQQLDKQAAEVVKAFSVLTAAGGDAAAIAVKMGDDVLALVNQYKAAGVEIPAALRPVLEAMLRNGQLVDENGEAYASLEEAGITFAETMTESMQRVMDHIQRLVEVLARGFNIPVNVNYHTTGTPPGDGGHQPPKSLPEFATGGYTGAGSMAFPAMLHPNEFVFPEDKLQKLLAGAIAMANGRNGGSAAPIIVMPAPVEIGGRALDQHVSKRFRQGGMRTPQQQRGRRA